MANSSIWDTIRSIHSLQVSEPSTDSVDALSKELENKLKSRHSGISGALVFIYDWLTQNNAKIQEAIGTIKEKKITILKNRLNEQASQINDLKDEIMKLKPIDTKKEEDIEKVKFDLNEQINNLNKKNTEQDSYIKELENSLKQNQSVVDDLKKKLAEKSKTPDQSSILKDIVSYLGGVQTPKKEGEFSVSYEDNQFKIAIRIPYTTPKESVTRFHWTENPFVAKTIVENIKQILQKQYNLCSSKTIPSDGRCFCFENNSLFYCTNGSKSGTAFDLTQPIDKEKLDKLYDSYLPRVEKVNQDFLDALDQEKEDDFAPTRTVLSHKTFKKVTQKNRQPAYKNDKLVVGEKSWTPITSSVTQACKGSFASMGSSPSREICTVDYATSEELRRIYTELQEKIQKKHEEFLSKEFYDLVGFEEFVLRETLEKVQEVFNKTEGEEQIEAIVNKARDDTENPHVFYDKTQKIPIISLDTFIKEKTGICRHRAMLFLVLASKLKEDGFLMGEVRQVRDMVQGGAHAWNLYCSPVNQPDKTSHDLPEKPNVYLLDAMWNTFGLIKKGSPVPHEKHYLKDGEKTISDKLERHINKLEQSVKEFVGFGWFFDEDADRLAKSLGIFRSSQSGLLAIRKSSNKPEIIIEFKEKTDGTYAFTVPKEKFNQKLLNDLRKELTTKSMTNDLAKKVVDKYLAKIGGSVRLPENGKYWVYRGAEKPLEEFVL